MGTKLSRNQIKRITKSRKEEEEKEEEEEEHKIMLKLFDI